ncbi:MAG: RDD family protein [Dermatophilaceae bacterium]
MAEPSFAMVGVTEDDLVTGEAVALDLPAASVGLRMVSGFIDYLVVQMSLFALTIAVVTLTTRLDAALASSAMLLAVVTAYVGVPVTMETLTRGRTLGKLAVGTRTVRDDAGPITFRHALTRGLVGVVEVYLLWGIPAIVSCVLSGRGKRLGDVAAGTYVVRDRLSAYLPPPVPMPPHLAWWAQGADIAALPDGLSTTVRSFLPAAFSMTPEARERMGRQLLSEVMLYVSPPPPAGSHAEYVLAAVTAERRRRDMERLFRDAVTRDRLIPVDPVDATATPGSPARHTPA